MCKDNEKLTKEIIEYPDGSYSFDNVPEEGRYIVISKLVCGTRRKAVNQARRLNPHFNYVVVSPEQLDNQ